MSTLTLRDYQEDAIAAVEAGSGRQLVACPTGSGKTVIFSELLRRRGGTALILAHRDELLQQAAGKLRFVAPELALNVGFVQAGRNDVGAPIVVGSVQTLASAKRLAQLPTTFDTVIVDEAHHAAADSYRRILAHVAESAMIVGFTATPERADDKDLRNVFDTLAYARSLEDMIREGYLCDLRALRVTLEDLDLKKVKKSGGDYAAGALGHAMEEAHAAEHVVAAYLQHAKGLRTVAFFPTVALSQEAADAFNAAGVKAAHIDGTTDADTRREVLEDLNAGRIDVCTNCNLLCLDSETEILTDSGWTNSDEMSTDHLVANWWFDGSITWEKPKQIIHRERGLGERMVYLETWYRSIRVTEGHRMVHRVNDRSLWAKSPARDIVGKSLQLPVSGRCEPRPFVATIANTLGDRALRRRISHNAYTLRTREAYSWDASFAEAERRVRHRQTLRHKAPSELSLDECWLIGFWIGDGSVGSKARGGVEYSITQSTAYPAIIARVDAALAATGIHANRYEVRAAGNAKMAIRWTLPRGTGSGSQQRIGVFAIEEYLTKNGTDLFWCLDEEHFDALIEGLWFADGDHGLGETVPTTLRIHGSNAILLERLQAIAVCRGYRAHMHRPKPVARPHHTPMRQLVLRKEPAHRMSSRVAGSVLRVEDGWKPEQVWCVRTTSSNLITRRRGTVTIMGNSEGWDEPSLECIIIATPTRSRIKYAQMVGRGTRLYPGKESCLILDLAGVSDDLTLQSVGMLFDLKAPPKPGETALKARDRELAEEDAALEAEQALDSERREAARIRKLAAERRNLFDRDSIQWIRHGERWALGLKDALLVLDHFAEGTAGWRVLLLHENANSPTGMSYRVAAQNLDLGYAQGAAEHLVRTSGAVALADKHAPWRSQPATKGQRGRLWHLGVRLPAGSTKGQAADLITQTIAEQRLERFDRATQSKETVAA